jgi:toxin ParE1/3/4
MNYQILLLTDAEQDLIEIYQYILVHESVKSADDLLDKIEQAVKNLATFPNRGHVPPELIKISVLSYQEIHYKNFRIIYEVENKKVYVHAVLDCRRDLQDLLEKRLLR